MRVKSMQEAQNNHVPTPWERVHAITELLDKIAHRVTLTTTCGQTDRAELIEKLFRFFTRKSMPQVRAFLTDYDERCAAVFGRSGMLKYVREELKNWTGKFVHVTHYHHVERMDEAASRVQTYFFIETTPAEQRAIKMLLTNLYSIPSEERTELMYRELGKQDNYDYTGDHDHTIGGQAFPYTLRFDIEQCANDAFGMDTLRQEKPHSAIRRLGWKVKMCKLTYSHPTHQTIECREPFSVVMKIEPKSMELVLHECISMLERRQDDEGKERVLRALSDLNSEDLRTFLYHELDKLAQAFEREELDEQDHDLNPFVDGVFA
jgi:hypothetical protein